MPANRGRWFCPFRDKRNGIAKPWRAERLQEGYRCTRQARRSQLLAAAT